MSVSPYDIRTERTRKVLLGGRTDYIVNKYYKYCGALDWVSRKKGNFYFYINNKGYIHIVSVGRVIWNGSVMWFQIVDSMLTKEDTLREVSRYGKYKTIEGCIKAIESKM